MHRSIRRILLLLAILAIGTVASAQVVIPKRGVYALYNGNGAGRNGNAETYLLPNPNVIGCAMDLVWSSVTTDDVTYNWNAIDGQLDVWWKDLNMMPGGGYKKCALIVQMVGVGMTAALPQYVITALNAAFSPSPGVIASCPSEGPNTSVPPFTSATFQTPFTTFLTHFFAKYGNDPRVAYIRVGFGDEGETFLPCKTELEAAPYNITRATYIAYIQSFLAVEQGLQGTVPLVVAMNVYPQCTTPHSFMDVCYQQPDQVASTAAGLAIGLSDEGLKVGDITNYNAGFPCNSNWCKEFLGNPKGPILLVQPNQPTCWLTTDCANGSPSVWLPFANSLGAFIAEFPTSDMYVAYGNGPAPGGVCTGLYCNAPYPAIAQATFAAFDAIPGASAVRTFIGGTINIGGTVWF